jgi:hypothetical protein
MLSTAFARAWLAPPSAVAELGVVRRCYPSPVNEANEEPTDIATQFRELHRSIERTTSSTVLLSDCEPQFSRLMDFVRSHPDSRAQFTDCFIQILSTHITRFCMRHLQWPEIAAAARHRMQQDIHNSEYESLQKLLGVYEQSSPNGRNA